MRAKARLKIPADLLQVSGRALPLDAAHPAPHSGTRCLRARPDIPVLARPDPVARLGECLAPRPPRCCWLAPRRMNREVHRLSRL